MKRYSRGLAPGPKLIFGVALTGALVASAQAQQPQDTGARVASAADSASDNDTGRPEEIIVTARKREENLQSVPIAITALTADDIRAENIISPMDLKNHTPGLEM